MGGNMSKIIADFSEISTEAPKVTQLARVGKSQDFGPGFKNPTRRLQTIRSVQKN